MIVKITNELMALVGATTAEEFPVKLSEKVKSMGDVSADVAALTKTVTTLAECVSSLQATVGKLPTEARVTELVTAGVTTSMSAWAGSEDGKKLIGAQASKIAMEAISSVGTVPVKAAPIPAESVTNDAKALIAAGKYQDAFPLLKPEARAEFFNNPKAYSAFMRANACGQVRISGDNEEFNERN